MLPDFSAVFFLAFIGFGAVVGCCFAPVIALAALFFPALWPWLFVPVPLCALGGLIVALVLK